MNFSCYLALHHRSSSIASVLANAPLTPRIKLCHFFWGADLTFKTLRVIMNLEGWFEGCGSLSQYSMVLSSSGTIHGAFIAYRLKVMSADQVSPWLLKSSRILGVINVAKQSFMCVNILKTNMFRQNFARSTLIRQTPFHTVVTLAMQIEGWA